MVSSAAFVADNYFIVDFWLRLFACDAHYVGLLRGQFRELLEGRPGRRVVHEFDEATLPRHVHLDDRAEVQLAIFILHQHILTVGKRQTLLPCGAVWSSWAILALRHLHSTA